MIVFFLAGSWLVAVEAVDAFPGMHTEFVFMNDGILGSGVTLRAFAGSAHKFGGGLVALNLWPCSIHKERREYQSKGNYDGEEHRSKGHEIFRSWRLVPDAERRREL